jgi:hypothetical protein
MINGRKEVAGIGTASVTHHVIIHAATATTLFAPGEIKVSGRTIQRIINNKGPKKNPIWRPDCIMFTNAIFEVFSKLVFLVPVSNLFF